MNDEQFRQIMEAIDLLDRKVDALIAALVLQEQTEVARLTKGAEIKCSWCRSAGRVVSNCPECGGSGG